MLDLTSTHKKTAITYACFAVIWASGGLLFLLSDHLVAALGYWATTIFWIAAATHTWRTGEPAE